MRSHTARARLVLSLSLGSLCLIAGCDGADDEEVLFDRDAVLERVADYQTTHVAANEPVLGSHGAMMQVWLVPDQVDDYLAIVPSDRPELEFPTGTLIIKDHLDEDGAVFESTVMYKAKPGYSPEGGDWWYGEFDAEGALVEGGPDIVTCFDCHASAAKSDWIHGLPE